MTTSQPSLPDTQAQDGADALSALPSGPPSEPSSPPSIKSPPALDQAPSFDQLIKGDYKQDFQNKVDQIINRRFAKAKLLEEELENYKAYQPLLDSLRDKYGLKTADPALLLKAIKQEKPSSSDSQDSSPSNDPDNPNQLELLDIDNPDRVNHSEEIEESDSQDNKASQPFPPISPIEPEGEATQPNPISHHPALAHHQRRQALNRLIQSQVDSTRSLYGTAFDIDKEMANPQFLGLLRAGVDVQSAFELTNRDQLLSAAIENAVLNTKQRLVRDIQARGKRPLENPSGAGIATPKPLNLQNLSRQAELDIERRVQRGERIGLEELRSYL